MKYCVHCGAEMFDEAVVCVKCGRMVEQEKPAVVRADDDAMSTVIKVFLILGCIAQGWLLLPLAWCLPITISIFNAMRDRRLISTGTKVCALIFVNLIAGICLLCVNDNQKN
jgi:uncharacterized membrane protein YvbJ